MTASPGCQPSGVATPLLSVVCKAVISGLQSLHQAQKLGNRTAFAHGVIHHRPQNTLVINDEGGSYSRRITSSRLNHAVSMGNLHGQVFNNGKWNRQPPPKFGFGCFGTQARCA